MALAEAEGPLEVPVIVSEVPRHALAIAASRWSGRQPEVMVAVTGTNGKTSVASFTRQIWEALGETAVNFGTVGVEGAVAAPLGHTTPEPVTLHRLLADLADKGVTHAAMEASSHGLDQRRLDGVALAAAGFTNLTRDHLDYHADFEAYFAAKLGLFERVLPRQGTAVVNLDDPHGPRVRRIAKRRGQKLVTVGRAEGCDLRLIGQRFDATGQEVLFAWAGKSHKARLDLIGGFQAHNALVAAGLAIGSGSAPEAVLGALPGLRTVRGRMERAATRANGAAVFVDYAHTPDALTTALTALRPHVMGRLIVVFGAGGDRDRGKRPLMGAAATAAADVVYVTDDNPRTEDRGRDPRGGARGRAGGDGDRRPGRGDPDRGRCAAAGRRAADRRQGPRDRAGDRPGHPAVRRYRAGERRGRGARRARGMTPLCLRQRRERRVGGVPVAAWRPRRGPTVRAGVGRGRRAVTGPLWSRDAAVAATGGASARDWAASGVSIDTRSLQPGDLFVALSAARDGHDFVADALAKGAAAALVARRPEGVAADAPLLVVPDVLDGLRALARAARARFAGRVVAVTGSVGKTGTKEMLRTALGVQGTVHAAEKSFNNHWGVPLTLARLASDRDFAVIEIGMNAPGEIAPLARLARPHVAMITTVEAVHLAAFRDIRGIAREKAAIFQGLEPSGVAVLNRDTTTYPILLAAARRAWAPGRCASAASDGRSSGSPR